MRFYFFLGPKKCKYVFLLCYLQVHGIIVVVVFIKKLYLPLTMSCNCGLYLSDEISVARIT